MPRMGGGGIRMFHFRNLAHRRCLSIYLSQHQCKQYHDVLDYSHVYKLPFKSLPLPLPLFKSMHHHHRHLHLNTVSHS